MMQQWERGVALLRYGLEAQLSGAKTMAFYEQENREQRQHAETILQKKYDLEDEVDKLKSKLRLKEDEVRIWRNKWLFEAKGSI